jgi:Protein of unknown function (DUF2750)
MSIAALHAAAFYREVAKSGVVWTVEDGGGFPAPLGTSGKRAMPFWSSQSRALRIIRNVPAFKGFSPVAIEWREFCENWVPVLEEDGLLTGVNWSGSRAAGYDIAPADLKRNVESVQPGT